MVEVEKMALRVPEAAQALGLSRGMAYKLVAEGTLPSIRVGRSIRVPMGALREWLRKQEEVAGGADR